MAAMVTRFGVVIPPAGPWAAQSAAYRWAEDVGYDVAYSFDHLTHATVRGEWLADGFLPLAAAATSTSRIELGTLVASATLRSPVSLARLAITLQDLSGGRAVLGLGAGSPACAGADRGARPSPAEMFTRYADVVSGYQAVLRGDQEWQGSALSFTGVETAPRPDGVADPFLVLAAHGPRALRLAVEHGDGWNTYGGPSSTRLEPGQYWALVGQQVARVDELCERAGRDPRSLRRSVLLGFGAVRPTADVTSYAEAAERATELGFDELVVYAPDAPAGMGSDPHVHEEALGRLR